MSTNRIYPDYYKAPVKETPTNPFDKFGNNPFDEFDRGMPMRMRVASVRKRPQLVLMAGVAGAPATGTSTAYRLPRQKPILCPTATGLPVAGS